MKIIGQILKFAIVFYLVYIIMQTNLPFKFSLIDNNKFLVGIILLLGFIGFYITDAVLEYRDISQREHLEKSERKAKEEADSVQEDYRVLNNKINIVHQNLSGKFKRNILNFTLWFVIALGSVIGIVVSNSVALRLVASLSFAVGAIAARVYWVTAVEDAARDYNLTHSLNHRQDIDRCVSHNKPFALYLQDFASSSDTKWGASRPYLGSKTSSRNPSEEMVVNKLSNLLPVFAFHNYLYPDISPSRRVLCDEDTWFRDFQHYSFYAKLLIVDAHEATPGVRSEMLSIADRNFGSKTVLVATTEELNLLRDHCLGFINQVRWKCKLESRDYFKDAQFEFADEIFQDIKQSLNLDGNQN